MPTSIPQGTSLSESPDNNGVLGTINKETFNIWMSDMFNNSPIFSGSIDSAVNESTLKNASSLKVLIGDGFLLIHQDLLSMGAGGSGESTDLVTGDFASGLDLGVIGGSVTKFVASLATITEELTVLLPLLAIAGSAALFGEAINLAGQGLGALATGAGDLAKGAGEGLGALSEGLGKGIGSIEEGAGKFLEGGGNFVKGVGEGLNSAFNGIGDVGQKFLEGAGVFADKAAEGGAKLIGAGAEAAEKLVGAVGDLHSKWLEDKSAYKDDELRRKEEESRVSFMDRVLKSSDASYYAEQASFKDSLTTGIGAYIDMIFGDDVLSTYFEKVQSSKIKLDSDMMNTIQTLVSDLVENDVTYENYKDNSDVVDTLKSGVVNYLKEYYQVETTSMIDSIRTSEKTDDFIDNAKKFLPWNWGKSDNKKDPFMEEVNAIIENSTYKNLVSSSELSSIRKQGLIDSIKSILGAEVDAIKDTIAKDGLTTLEKSRLTGIKTSFLDAVSSSFENATVNTDIGMSNEVIIDNPYGKDTVDILSSILSSIEKVISSIKESSKVQNAIYYAAESGELPYSE